MFEAIYAELKGIPAYVRRVEQTLRNKAPSRSTPVLR